MEKQKLIETLTYLRDNFNPASQSECNSFYNLVMQLSENNETDTEILQLCESIYSIIANYTGDIINDLEPEPIDFAENIKDFREKKANNKLPNFNIDIEESNRLYYQYGTRNYQPFLLHYLGIFYHDLPSAVKKCFSFRILCPQAREPNYMIMLR